MTDEQLIQQIEAALAALKAGDESALDRLSTLVGDIVGGDRITIGDISGSTAVAIGSDIRVSVKQISTLPPEIVSRLVALADALDRQALDTFRPSGHIRVFLSSPGDVQDERKLALKAIAKLQSDPLYKEKITIEAVAWDKPDDSTPMLASVDPQTAINMGLARPSECDIVVVVFWARMGTPLDPDRYQKFDGAHYLSGTEWEFEDAVTAARETGRPFVLVYRRTEEPKISLEDPDLAERIAQYRRVKDFFGGFVNPDGSIRQGYNPYATPTEFEDLFELHLKKLIARLIEQGQPKHHQAEVSLDTVNLVPPVEWPPEVSPFPGLRAFGSEDAPVFFGRGAEVDRLVKRLAEPDCRFLAVMGASGSGKSSLVAAGLIPRLAAGAVQGSADWSVIRFTPDEWGEGDPFASLAAALIADPLRLDGRGLVGRLRAPGMLRQALEAALNGRPAWAQALLFIDQFEELFTRIQDEEKRKAFASMLSEASQSSRVRTVITLRADFFHRVAELPVLAALLKAQENRTFPLSAPGLLELYEMISDPARVAGLAFDDGLAREILEDTGDDPGALALMAYALQQLYEESRAADGRLTRVAYRRFGGVQGAIGEQAHDAFERLDAAAQAALPAVFRELVEVDERGTATRKRAPLASVARDEASAQLVSALTEARLLVTSGGEFPIVEVAHEALFRSWPRLKDWINEAQDDLILLRQVRQAAQDWAGHDFSAAYLWPEERLKPVYAMAERLRPELSELERDFIRSEFDRLMEEVNNPATTHKRRSWIGERFDTIGDRRPGVGLVTVHPPPLSDPREVRLWGEEHAGLPDVVWVPVGGGKIDIEGQTFIVAPFCVAKHPITYAQFQAFIDAEDGFGNPAWWKDLAADESHRRAPGEQNFKFWNNPRETVSWWDAIAFCQWLTARLGLPRIPADLTPQTLAGCRGIRLPAEWEWQWAASGEGAGLEYPWGPDLDGAKANTSESGLGRTTAVGIYPAGAAPCGALDMAGNVWEWCLNEPDPAANLGLGGDAPRAVGGGSWFGNQAYARASFRYFFNPSSRGGGYGFRVVVCRPPDPGLKPPG